MLNIWPLLLVAHIAHFSMYAQFGPYEDDFHIAPIVLVIVIITR